MVELRTGQLHLRRAVNRGGTSLALATAVDLAVVRPTLLVLTADVPSVEERLSRLGLCPRGSQLSIMVTDDVGEVFADLARLELTTGVPPALVVVHGEQLLAGEVRGRKAPGKRFIKALRPFLRRDAIAVVHVRADVRVGPGQRRSSFSEVRLEASTIAILTCLGDLDLIRVELTQNANGEPSGSAHFLVDEGEARDATPRATMSVERLRSYDEGRTLLREALEGTDTETRKSLVASWGGTLEELQGVLAEVGPDAATRPERRTS